MKLFRSSSHLLAIFNPITCVLLATGSLIVLLVWIFFDFFTGMASINVYAWLPLIVLLSLIALLMSRQWAVTVLSLLVVVVCLSGLYYLLMGIGLLVWIPHFAVVPVAVIFLILLNGSVIWLTRKVHNIRASGERRTENARRQRRFFLRQFTKATLSVAIGGLFVKTYLWDDPSRKWLLTDLFHQEPQKLTLAPPLETIFTDASYLNTSKVAEIRAPKTVAEVIAAVNDAKARHQKISLSGVRHSMGGQALGQNTLHLDMTHMDTVRYNVANQTITAGPGATWQQIQTALSPHGRAVQVMQDSNIFTIGGSLSVNAHGKDPRYGSLIESVNFIKIVTADGNEVFCDRTQNRDLFSAAIGGFGLLGIITEVNIQTTQNTLFSFSMLPVQTHTLIDTLETLCKDPKNRLVEAHLSVDAEHFLSESLIYKYAEVPAIRQPGDELDGENSIWLRKIVFQASRASNFGKYFRWEMEKYVSPLVEPAMVSRNTAMAVPVRFLQNPDPQSTDILQEYFVPIEQANVFIAQYAKLIKKYAVDLLNVTIRRVAQDINALVSYAQKDMYGFVVYYKIRQNTADVHTIDTFTRELIDYLISLQATYYLCYGGYYSSTQLTTMYPAIRKLVALKRQRDPHMLFTNVWFEKYYEDIVRSLLV